MLGGKKKATPKHDISLSVPQRERMLRQKDRESQGQRRVSAELCQRGNGAEGMGLNQERVGGHRENKECSGIRAGDSKRNDTRRW